jgi:hypothetical protein
MIREVTPLNPEHPFARYLEVQSKKSPRDAFSWDWGLYLASSSAHDDGIENVY